VSCRHLWQHWLCSFFGSELHILCYVLLVKVPDGQALVLADMTQCFAAVVVSCLGWTSAEVVVAFLGSMVVGCKVASFTLSSEPSKVLLMICD
jgi:hypothetical protein